LEKLFNIAHAIRPCAGTKRESQAGRRPLQAPLGKGARSRRAGQFDV